MSSCVREVVAASDGEADAPNDSATPLAPSSALNYVWFWSKKQKRLRMVAAEVLVTCNVCVFVTVVTLLGCVPCPFVQVSKYTC